MGKKKKHNRNNWNMPANYLDYFNPKSDMDFKMRHPVGYFFLVILGITALLLPMILFGVFGALAGTESYWVLLGCAGGFIFGIGLFNYVAIIIDQFLGHWLSIICFSTGSVMMLISWLLWR